MKRISCYVKFLKAVVKRADVINDVPVTGITNDSRIVRPGYLFVAISGEKSDGHCYIDDAINAGAVGIVFSGKITLPCSVNRIAVSDAYFAYALAAEYFYDCPAELLRITGITGTNGKTTTAYMLNSFLQSADSRCGLITTVKYVLGERVLPASRTTPEAIELQKLFMQMVDADCHDVIMETSSHGLFQHRLGRAKCKTAVFTNLTGDHLDYHRTMEEYFKAKSILFTEYLSNDGYAVVNIDDPYGKRLIRMLPGKKIITFGKEAGSSLRIGNVELRRDGSSFLIEYKNNIIEFDISMAGEHNIYNFTAAFAAALTLGVPISNIRKRGAEPFEVPGRLELLQLKKSPAVYVDYAHTDDALKNILETLEQIKTGKIITLFGCGGDRDKSKRARMGSVAAKYSDYIILTNDNPRTENPDQILSDISSGITDDCPFEIIPDRATAISHALKIAVHEDIVLIAGKGHESTQEQNGIFTPFDDRQVTIRLMQSFF